MCDLKLHTLWSSIKTDGYIGNCRAVGYCEVMPQKWRQNKKSHKLFPDGTSVADSFLFRSIQQLRKVFL